MSLYSDYLDDKDEEELHRRGREEVKREKEYEDFLKRTAPDQYRRYVLNLGMRQCS